LATAETSSCVIGRSFASSGATAAISVAPASTQSLHVLPQQALAFAIRMQH